MTSQKSFKEAVRTRMEKTGESYATARRRLLEKGETAARKERTPKTISRTRSSEESVVKATGKTWPEWFKLLGKSGAATKTHSEIAKWLSENHEISGWWAQQVTVAFEQEIVGRSPGQRADGTFAVSANRTINAGMPVLFRAFENENTRSDWLGDVPFDISSVRPEKSIRLQWEGKTKVSIDFYAKGDLKSQVSIQHEKIADAKSADELKAFWKQSLVRLKKVIEE